MHSQQSEETGISSDIKKGSREEEVMSSVNDNIVERVKYMDPADLEKYFLSDFSLDISLANWRIKDMSEADIVRIREEIKGNLSKQVLDRGFNEVYEEYFISEVNSAFVEVDTSEKISDLIKSNNHHKSDIKSLLANHSLSFTARWRLEEKFKDYLVDEAADLNSTKVVNYQYVDEVDSLGVALVPLIRKYGHGIDSRVEAEFEKLAKMKISDFLAISGEKYANVPYYLKQT